MGKNTKKSTLFSSLAIIMCCVLPHSSQGASLTKDNLHESKRGYLRESRILGGSITSPNEFPSVISIQYPSIGHFCAGSVINSNWIVTAGHCTGEAKPELIRIVAGEYSIGNVDSTEQHRKVKRIVVHPMYERAQLAYDVALIELSSPLNMSTRAVQPVQLPPQNSTPNYYQQNSSTGENVESATAITIGWGRQGEKGPISDIIQKVSVPLVTEEKCKEQYAGTLYSVLPSTICAGTPSSAACLGDSGGPLFCKNEIEMDGSYNILCGIALIFAFSNFGTFEVSGGLSCGSGDFAGFYSRVSSFSDWIVSTAS